MVNKVAVLWRETKKLFVVRLHYYFFYSFHFLLLLDTRAHVHDWLVTSDRRRVKTRDQFRSLLTRTLSTYKIWMVGLRTSSRTAFSLISELPDHVHVHTYDINSRYCTMMDGAKDIKNLIPQQPTTLSLLSQSNNTTRTT